MDWVCIGLIGVVVMLTSGCSTIQTMRHPDTACGCPGDYIRPRYVYSGVRCDLNAATTPGYWGFEIFWSPFDLIADTVVLPVQLVRSAAHYPQRKQYKSLAKARINSISR